MRSRNKLTNKKYIKKSRKISTKKSRKTSYNKSSKKSFRKKKIQGGKYRFNYNLQLFEKII